jgi:hypothetical protein
MVISTETIYSTKNNKQDGNMNFRTIPLDLLDKETRSEKLLVMTTPKLKKHITELANKMQVSRNELINKILDKACQDIFERELEEIETESY